MTTITQEHLPLVVAMMPSAPPVPVWWNRRDQRAMPKARHDIALTQAVRDAARDRGIKPAGVRQRVIDLGDGAAWLPNEELSSIERAIVGDISMSMADARDAYQAEVERASQAAWRAAWAVVMVTAAVDAIAAQIPPPAPAP